MHLLRTLLVLLFPVALSAQPASIEITVNGQVTAHEDLMHRFFCIQENDTFRVQYLGGNGTDTYLLTGLEIWGQVNLGRPTLLGKLGYSQPGPQPAYVFTIKQFDMQAALYSTTSAVRAGIKLGPVARVEGSRVLETLPLPNNGNIASLLLVKTCQ
ncbi:MAG: hypothetical protein OHK0039_29890 [Bacteroidia bacterium]